MLKAEFIHKIYPTATKEVAVLKGIDIFVKRGEFIAIVGPSGAGKSTLLHILGGLEPPTQGRVLLEEKDIYASGEASLARIRNRCFGFVFQFYHLIGALTVLENVFLPALIRRQETGVRENKSAVIKKARNLLEKMGLGERADFFPSQLSGGEQQRVAIARSLINEPQVLFCDEPTGNLDSQRGTEIINLIKELNRTQAMTVVLVTHNRELAAGADKVYNLRDGVLNKIG